MDSENSIVKLQKKSKKIIFWGVVLVVLGICGMAVYAKRDVKKELYYTLDWTQVIEKIVNTKVIICENESLNCRFDGFKVQTANPLLERDRDWEGGRSIVAVCSCDYVGGSVQDTCTFELLVNVKVKTHPGRLSLPQPYVDDVKLKNGAILPEEAEECLRNDIRHTWGGDVILNDLAEKDNHLLSPGRCKLLKDGVILYMGEGK